MVGKWESIADEIHSMGYTYGFASYKAPGEIGYVADAMSAEGVRYVVRAETLDAAFDTLRVMLPRKAGNGG